MIQRCFNPNAGNYNYYGGRGITVCEEWVNSFERFRDWSIDNNFKEELTLDRIDTNGDYCPENCRWVSWKVQQNNRRNNTTVEFGGNTYTLSEAADLLGENYNTFRSRVYRKK